MDINKLKDFIKSKINEVPDIITIYKTGSNLFCDVCKDRDYTVVINNNFEINNLKYLKYFDTETNEDYFIWSKNEYDKMLNFETSILSNLFIIADLFKENNTLYGSNKIELNLLEKQNDYKNMIKKVLPKSLLNPRVKWNDSDKYCHKLLWWVILGLKFIEQNNYNITDEMLDIINKCHNGVLSKEWETYIIERINL